jgi:endonuclease/exonuclease/phosphatase family metal-dependent hydrolase
MVFMSLIFFHHGFQFSAAAAPRPLHLKVMSYNLKYASESGPHAWSRRRPLVRDLIRAQAPDLIGTQEGLDGQLGDLTADLPEYGRVGSGREGGAKGEFSAIFYNKTKFKLLEAGDFWLSDTPEVAGSRSWGNLLPRMATRVLLEDVVTGAKLYHFNTHFDHLIPRSRSKSAELLARRIAGRKLTVPVVVTGDFNTSQLGSVHATLAPPEPGATALRDACDIALAREGQRLSTFHHWKGPVNGGKRIDWILASGDFACSKWQVITTQENGMWPSDHFPVVSELVLAAPARELLTAAADSTATLGVRE